MAQTLFDKIWNEHVVIRNAGFPDTLYIDTHVINKIMIQGAFEGLRKRHIQIFRPNQTILMADSDFNQHIPPGDLSGLQMDMFNSNCNVFGPGRQELRLSNPRLPIALPGQTVVCDPDNAAKMGAFGAIAIGIGELQVDQVLATQCILIEKPKKIKIELNGRLTKGLGAEDIIKYLISEIPHDVASGHFIEYAGNTILNLNMEGRMAICSMSREIAASGGIIAPDETTFEYIAGLGLMPEDENPEETLSIWNSLFSDESSVFDEVLEFDAEDIGSENFGIHKVNYKPSFAELEKPGVNSYADSIFVAGYNDTDYILKHLEIIEEFENSKMYKIFNGA